MRASGAQGGRLSSARSEGALLPFRHWVTARGLSVWGPRCLDSFFGAIVL